MTVVALDEKTPGKAEMVEIHFTSGDKEKMPKVRFELISSDVKLDATAVRERLKARVGAMLFGILHEYGILWEEVNPVIDAMGGLVDRSFEKASDVKWGFIKPKLPLIEINNILLDEYARKNNDGVGSKGSGTDTGNKK